MAGSRSQGAIDWVGMKYSVLVGKHRQASTMSMVWNAFLHIFRHT
jgi:hypothetical protein